MKYSKLIIVLHQVPYLKVKFHNVYQITWVAVFESILEKVNSMISITKYFECMYFSMDVCLRVFVLRYNR